MNPQSAMRTIVVQTINCGEWRHWQWIIKAYGRNNVRGLIAEIPASEFRPEALALAAAIFGIKEMKYASRSAYIRAQKARKTRSTHPSAASRLHFSHIPFRYSGVVSPGGK